MIATALDHEPQCEANVDTMLDRVFADLDWREPPPICEWLEENIRFGPGNSDKVLESRIGPMTFHDSPWWRFPLECAADRRCRRLAMPAATQVHKTANLLFGLALYKAEWMPAPGMFVLPGEDDAIKYRDRLYRIVEESQKFATFRRLRVPPEYKWNKNEIDLGSMVVHLAWSGGRSQTRSKPCHTVWFSEVDVFRDADKKAGDPVEAGMQRTKDVYNFTHIFESSPSDEPSRVVREERGCESRWRWHIKCPTCGKEQAPRFFRHKEGDYAGSGGVLFTVAAKGEVGDEELTEAQANRHAHYVCENGCAIGNSQKRSITESGRWLPVGWKRGQKIPKLEPVESMGFKLWGVHSPNETFGTLAAGYVRACENGTRVDYLGNRLAMEHRLAKRVPSWKKLGERLAARNLKATVPKDVWFLTAGIDKQAENNGSRFVVRGWAPGKSSWLVDWGWIVREEMSDVNGILSDLLVIESELIEREFEVVNKDGATARNPLGKTKLPILLMNIDTNHLPHQINKWMRTLDTSLVDRYDEQKNVIRGRVRNIRGDASLTRGTMFRHSLVEANTRTGKPYEGGLHWWHVNVYHYYSELTDWICGKPGEVGSWHVAADTLARGAEYLKQVTNFAYQSKIVRGVKKSAWRPISTSTPVDFWDCEIYATAAADMIADTIGWSPAAWNEWLAENKRKKQVAKANKTRQRQRSTRVEPGVGDR